MLGGGGVVTMVADLLEALPSLEVRMLVVVLVPIRAVSDMGIRPVALIIRIIILVMKIEPNARTLPSQGRNAVPAMPLAAAGPVLILFLLLFFPLIILPTAITLVNLLAKVAPPLTQLRIEAATRTCPFLPFCFLATPRWRRVSDRGSGPQRRESGT